MAEQITAQRLLSPLDIGQIMVRLGHKEELFSAF